MSKSGSVSTVTAGLTAVVLVGPNPSRRTLWISPPSGARVSIADKPGVALGEGLQIENATVPVKLDYG